MSDDFGTVNVRRGDRAREFDVLRQKYRAHRESLVRMAADAPTDRLAGEYQRMIAEIDGALRKLDEVEGRAPATSATGAGNRPLVTTAPPPEDTLTDFTPPPPADGRYVADVTPGNSGRLGLIAVIVVVALAAIGYMIWRASSDRAPKTPNIVEQQPVTTSTPISVTSPPPSAATAASPEATDALRVVPAVADYGVIRKGTRAVRQFEITNSSAAPLTVSVGRSACRCLYYDYNSKLVPKKKETITVTVDGSKAKVGPLQEQLEVKAKGNPAATASFAVQATIK